MRHAQPVIYALGVEAQTLAAKAEVLIRDTRPLARVAAGEAGSLAAFANASLASAREEHVRLVRTLVRGIR